MGSREISHLQVVGEYARQHYFLIEIEQEKKVDDKPLSYEEALLLTAVRNSGVRDRIMLTHLAIGILSHHDEAVEKAIEDRYSHIGPVVIFRDEDPDDGWESPPEYSDTSTVMDAIKGFGLVMTFISFYVVIAYGAAT